MRFSFFTLLIILLFLPNNSQASSIVLGSTATQMWASSASGVNGYAPLSQFLLRYTTTQNINLNSIDFPISHHTAGVCGSSNVYVAIYTSTSIPSTLGNLVATSLPVPCSSINSDSAGSSVSFSSIKSTFTFASPVPLSNSTLYSFLFYSDGGQYIRPLEGSVDPSYTFDVLIGTVLQATRFGASMVLDYTLPTTSLVLPPPFFGNEDARLSTTTCMLVGTDTQCTYTYATTTNVFKEAMIINTGFIIFAIGFLIFIFL